MRLFLVTIIRKEEPGIERIWRGSRSEARAVVKEVVDKGGYFHSTIEQIVLEKSKTNILNLLNQYS